MLTSATRTARHHSTTTDLSSANLPLLALAAASFGIGTTEYVVIGLLPDVAVDLGVSVPKVGNAIGAWAGGIALVHGVAYAALPWVGASFIAAALALAIVAHWTDQRQNLSGRRTEIGRAATTASTAQIARRGAPAIPGVSS